MEQYILDFLKDNKIEYEIVDGVIYTKGEPLPPNEPSKTDILMAENEKLKLENKQIWDTLEFLLRNTDFVPTGGA